MKVIENCWKKLAAHECQYGAHLFDGDTVSIYVNHWLWTFDIDIESHFSRKNKEGAVGHCLLVFGGIKRFCLEATPFSGENINPVWHKPISFKYTGTPKGPTSAFRLAGSFKGMKTSVDIEIEAERFELHVLDKDEPGREE